MSERLTPDQLEYHKAVLADYQRAHAAFASWSAYLSQKYDLKGPLEHITEDGEIVRVGTDEFAESE